MGNFWIVGCKNPAISLYNIDTKKILLGVDKLGNIADNEGRSRGETLERLKTGKPGRGRRMTYSKASELLGLTTPKSLKEQAEMAKSMLSRMTYKTPLRYKVAVDVLIRAAS